MQILCLNKLVEDTDSFEHTTKSSITWELGNKPFPKRLHCLKEYKNEFDKIEFAEALRAYLSR